ncbi:hypothetical protein [Actinokineospora inagensis]|uniref:hypothetical protein n=1 Tax=Actinokineospora inagensis TaxID=103730 RepID=UPI00047ED619|nr:hypothetical protein [Actinokineospora inagensis]
MTALELPPKALWGDVHGISDAGVAYGQLQMDSREPDTPVTEAVQWGPDGKARVLDAGETFWSEVWAVNDCGVAVGEGSYGPFEWDADGRGHRLTAPSGHYGGHAVAVNDRGAVVGEMLNEDNIAVAGVRWDEAGVPHELAGQPDTWSFSVGDINNHGLVVGAVQSGWGSSQYPVVWGTDDQPTELLGPKSEEVAGGEATKVTDSGYILGNGRTEDDHAYIWRPWSDH